MPLMARLKISASSGGKPRISLSGALVRAVLLFLFLEWLSRLWLYHLADRETFLQYAAINQIGSESIRHTRFKPHRYIGYIANPDFVSGINRHNHLGFRGEDFPLAKPAGEFRIVCLGSSATYGAYSREKKKDMDYRNSFPYQLEQILHARGYTQVRVVNAGLGGWTSWESLVNFQFRILPLSPDLVILYDGINDIRARMVWPPDAYQGDNSGTLDAQYSRFFMPPLWEYSTLIRGVLIATGQITPHASLSRILSPDDSQTAFGEEFLRQQLAGNYPSGIFRDVSAMQMLDHNPPIHFQRNMASIVDIARANAIGVLVSAIAYDPEHFPQYPSSASPEYIRGHEEHNRILAELAAARAVPFLDPNPQLPKDTEHFADGHHFTPQGAQVMATLLADALVSHQLLTAPPPSTTPVTPQ